MMVEQKISTKFITRFCFELNKKTYTLIVDYLKRHKDSKGEEQILYNDLWPEVIKDINLRAQIENIPTKILKSLNKDLSEAYHLLMESFSDQSLEKLFRYERIRDLYHFMTQIILKKGIKIKKESKQVKNNSKESSKKGVSSKKSKHISKNVEKSSEDDSETQNQWSYNEERYLCALYLQRPLMKCCEKLRQKFGESQKWSSTKKVFRKAEEIFQKSLKKALRFSQFKSLKQTLTRLQTTKENLIAQILKKKSNQIEKHLLKFYKSMDTKKKNKSLEEVNKEIVTLFEVPKISVEEFKQQKTQAKDENIIKEEAVQSKQVDKSVSEKIAQLNKQSVESSQSELRISLKGTESKVERK